MLRSAHGKSREGGHVLVVETSPPDELPAGTPAEPQPAVSDGFALRLRAGTPSADDQRAAGRARARQRAAERDLVRLGLPEGAGGDLAPFLREAERWAVSEVKRLAAHVGGGQCPPNVSALVRSAALAMAGSAAAYSRGDAALGA